MVGTNPMRSPAARHARLQACTPAASFLISNVRRLSRAQARRVTARLERFKRAELDFDGIADIGHAFADELFRVWGLNHPQVELLPINANARIRALIADAAAR